jgi:gamma-glutamyltranspeptidase/glutathione hydrolase
MKFTYTQKREWKTAAQRSVIMGSREMVAASQPLATLSGYKALSLGGNAVDAAVAMVSTLSVVEPYNVGLGGDAFALIYLAKEKRLIGMNASGRAPYQATIQTLRERGLDAIPERGIFTVTVPGALHGWNQALERFGNLSLSEVFEDAIDYAERGYPVSYCRRMERGSGLSPCVKRFIQNLSDRRMASSSWKAIFQQRSCKNL